MTSISFLLDNTKSTGNREKTGLRIGLVGIVINSLIFIFELFSGLATGSTTVTADAFHNSVDALSGVMTITVFLITGKPADSKHPFGFGRVEYLSSFLIGLLMTGIGLFFARSSLLKLLNPAPVRFCTPALVMMLVSILLKLLYSQLNRMYAQNISSPTLAAAGQDAMGDVLILTVSAVSLPVAGLTSIPIDGLLGLAVSCFILFSGGTVIKKAVTALIGTAPNQNVAETITSAVMSSGYVLGVHGLIVHDYGPDKILASIHAELPTDVPLVKAHQIVTRAEADIKNQGIDLVIHIDPVPVSGRGRYGRYRNFSPVKL